MSPFLGSQHGQDPKWIPSPHTVLLPVPMAPPLCSSSFHLTMSSKTLCCPISFPDHPLTHLPFLTSQRGMSGQVPGAEN